MTALKKRQLIFWGQFMNNIKYKQQQGTFTNVIISAGIFAQLCSASITINDPDTNEYKSLAHPSYLSASNLSTYTHIVNPITGDIPSVSNTFESVISDFYFNLLLNQKPLGKEFEEVLNDNLWDLYES